MQRSGRVNREQLEQPRGQVVDVHRRAKLVHVEAAPLAREALLRPVRGAVDERGARDRRSRMRIGDRNCSEQSEPDRREREHDTAAVHGRPPARRVEERRGERRPRAADEERADDVTGVVPPEHDHRQADPRGIGGADERSRRL